MGVASYETLTKDSKLPVASVHSHPSRINESIYDEICSMGYYEGAVMVGNDHDNLKAGKSPKYNLSESLKVLSKPRHSKEFTRTFPTNNGKRLILTRGCVTDNIVF